MAVEAGVGECFWVSACVGDGVAGELFEGECVVVPLCGGACAVGGGEVGEAASCVSGGATGLCVGCDSYACFPLVCDGGEFG